MLGLLGKGIKKLFGTKSDKDLKLLYPYVDKINSEFNKLSSISDQELRDKTVSFKEKISANTKKVSDQIKSLKEDCLLVTRPSGEYLGIPFSILNLFVHDRVFLNVS